MLPVMGQGTNFQLVPRRVARRVAELVEHVDAQIQVPVGVVGAGRVVAVAAVGALVDDRRDDRLAVLPGDLHALSAVRLGVEAVLAGDGGEVGVLGRAGVGDVLDGVDLAALGPVVAASGAVAAAVLGGPLAEVVVGERAVAAVIGEGARRRGDAAGAGRPAGGVPPVPVVPPVADVPPVPLPSPCRWCRRVRRCRRCRWCRRGRRCRRCRRRRRCRRCRLVPPVASVPPVPVVPPAAGGAARARAARARRSTRVRLAARRTHWFRFVAQVSPSSQPPFDRQEQCSRAGLATGVRRLRLAATGGRGQNGDCEKYA